MKNYWTIEVYDSLKLLHSEKVPLHRISETQMETKVLPLLVARFLTEREIIYSCVNKRKGGLEKFPFLDVNKSSGKGHLCLNTTGNPWALATPSWSKPVTEPSSP